MKFSEIGRDEWDALKPYLDTVLLPLSGLTGGEQPWEAVEALEKVRDALDPLESAFKGRVVTYPALHYAEDDNALAQLADEICKRLYEAGFAYCIIVAGDERLTGLPFHQASAVIGPDREEDLKRPGAYAERARRTVENLWRT